METAERRSRHSYSSSRRSVVVAGGVALSLAAAVLATPAAATSRLAPWSPPVNLSSSGGHSPDLAVSADGTTAVAVWLRKKDRGVRVVQARTAKIVDGAVKWSRTQDLSPVGATSASSPTVALSGDGDTAVVVWTQGWTTVRARTAHISKGKASWSPRQTVAPSGSGTVMYSRTVMSRDGSTVVATWIREDPTMAQVGQARTARIRSGTAVWKATHDLVSAVERIWEEAPQVAISRDGSTAVAAWRDVWGSVRSRAGGISRGAATWAAVQDVSPEAPGTYVAGVQVALSADGGTAMAVWWKNDFGTSGGPVVLARTASITGGVADWGSGSTTLSGAVASSAPHVAISSQGATAVVIWAAFSPDELGRIQSRAAAIQAGTATWSPLKNLTAPTQLTQSWGSDVALSADGTMAVAVWSISKVLSRTAHLTAGIPTWRKPTQVVSAQGGLPMVGLSGDGRTAVSLWNRFDGTGRLATYVQTASAFAP